MKYSYDFGEKKKKKKKRIIFAVIFLIITVVLALFLFRGNKNAFVNSASNVVAWPFKAVYNASSNTFGNVGKYFENSKKLSEENENLKNQKTELEYKLLETQKLLNDNESLRSMLEINSQFKQFQLKFGKIISREHDNWTQTFTIDLGSKDGIKVNQAVIHKDGLVGYISSVTDNTSTVLTILDPMVSVSVNISTLNEPAILQGDLDLKSNNKLKLIYIPIGAEISIGDMLYTSGLGSIYPNGVPVGKIVEVVNKKNDIDRYAIAETSVNIRTISEVGIIVN